MNVTKFLALLFVSLLSILTTVLTLMWGWGMEPKNWWAIIGLGIVAQTVLYTIGKKVIDAK